MGQHTEITLISFAFSLISLFRSWSVCWLCPWITGSSLWMQEATRPTWTTWSLRTQTAMPPPREVRAHYTLCGAFFFSLQCLLCESGILFFAGWYFNVIFVLSQWACWDLWLLRSTSSIKPPPPAPCLSAWSPLWRPGKHKHMPSLHGCDIISIIGGPHARTAPSD